ncbi:MAG: diguanylate cyclase [Coriobacteriia bacterium]|nr:diguanylate cyclase [Coriobacteriia bacterium]
MQSPSNQRPQNARPIRRFVFEAALALALFTVLVFAGIYWRTTTLMHDAAIKQADSYIDLLMNARAWNSIHGGVWVPQTPAVETNPYLRDLGVDAETSTVSGTALTLRDPATMTREIAQITDGEHGVTFGLTSLLPVNPYNAPDEWQRATLEKFSTDLTPVFSEQDINGSHVLRSMRPLLVDESCLPCHAKQGYRIGDVRGAIWLTLPLDETAEALAVNSQALLAVFALVLLISGLAGYALVGRMARRVDESERELQTLATTDPLTGIANRRAIVQRLEEELARSERLQNSIGVIEFDIDRFKHVNDSHGHAAGDETLRTLTRRIADVLREYDSVGRLGGEEFLVVAPDVDCDALIDLAERIREAAAASPTDYRGHIIPITVSVGATLSRPGDSAESALVRADSALYAAKDAGRDRVRTD